MAETETSHLLHGQNIRMPKTEATQLMGLFQPPPESKTEGQEGDDDKVEAEKDPNSRSPLHDSQQQQSTCWQSLPQVILTTVTGSMVSVMYHTVFCLAQGSALTRPHASQSSTGLMAKIAALGVMGASPVMIFTVADAIPALYPGSDLFMAPFLAHLAIQIDAELFARNLADEDAIFFGTFGASLMLACLLSGSLCVLAARVKIANLGAFLPSTVLAGFFSAIGLLMWTLGFNVDTGMTIGQVMQSNSASVWAYSLTHHVPSLLIGVVMHLAGRAHPLWVILLILGTILGSYVVLWTAGVSLAQAQEWKWFFSPHDLTAHPGSEFGPPDPLGVWGAITKGRVVWDAVWQSFPTILSLAFLYLIRCSLHSAAVKKNIPNVTRKKPRDAPPEPKKPPLTLPKILEAGYGYSQLAAALIGGIPVAPSVSASLTLFQLNAESIPPQYGSCVLLGVFYLTDFSVVQYIPKPAFSCLMVLSGIDLCRTWVFGTFYKTQDKWEWAVAPLLVAFAFWLGMLNAIFLGIAISTFLFVGNFYRAGNVRFVGSGLTLRSTAERGVREAEWLDENADTIQILVLQHYLFFGNAQSVLHYVSTMFEDVQTTSISRAAPRNDEEEPPLEGGLVLPPAPKFLIIDLAMVSGMDSSAVDLLAEIAKMVLDHRCTLYLSGMSPTLKTTLLHGTFQTSAEKTSEQFAFVLDLESALAKAEDGLLRSVYEMEESQRARRISLGDIQDGFVYTLEKIDEQHGISMAKALADLGKWVVTLELDVGEMLSPLQQRQNESRGGLYFVESGLMHLRQAATSTRSTRSKGSLGMLPPILPQEMDPTMSIGHMHARAGPVGKQTARIKQERVRQHHHSGFQDRTGSLRLARIGQGWVISTIRGSDLRLGGLAAQSQESVYVAMTQCRLHFLPATALEKLESAKPVLVLNLYKLLSILANKRQELTINQLGQFVRILHAPIPRLQGGKSDLARIHQGLSYPDSHYQDLGDGSSLVF